MALACSFSSRLIVGTRQLSHPSIFDMGLYIPRETVICIFTIINTKVNLSFKIIIVYYSPNPTVNLTVHVCVFSGFVIKMLLKSVNCHVSFCTLQCLKSYFGVSFTAVRHFTAKPLKPRKEKAEGHTVRVV